MPFFTDDYRTDLEGYDYCGDDHLHEESDPYESFSWRHYLRQEAEVRCSMHQDDDWCYYVAYRAI